jgi:hypothetical protein
MKLDYPEGGHQFAPAAIDAITSGRIKLPNIIELAKLDFQDQVKFLDHAITLSYLEFKFFVKKRVRKKRSNRSSRAKKLIEEAFHQWHAWTGNIPDAEEMEEDTRQINAAHEVVFAYLKEVETV